MKSSHQVLSIGIVWAASACAGHSAMNGSVVMTVSPQEAHVCVLDGDVSPGDTVRVIHHVCEEVPGARQATRRCRAETVGTAEVVERIGGHYVVVRAIAATVLRDGDTVEPFDE